MFGVLLFATLFVVIATVFAGAALVMIKVLGQK